MNIRRVEDMEKAAEKLSKLGMESLVLKGGHLKSRMASDLFYHKGKVEFYTKPRVKGAVHGSGCFFSAAITGYLTHGLSIPQAVEKAESIIQDVFGFGLGVGGGFKVVNPLIPLYNEAEKYNVVEEVKLALNKLLENKRFPQFVADVGSQVVMALPYPSTTQHVAAVEGRIKKIGETLRADGGVRFGVSSHIARLVLACNRLDPKVRAAINLRYNKKLLQALKKVGLTASSFDRKLEPKRVKTMEGETLGWGVEQVFKKAEKIPDVIYDLGGEGKEPMIRVTGRSILEVTEKIHRALEHLN